MMESELHPEEITFEVKNFICGTTTRSSQSSNLHEVTRTALKLLKNVPAARESVLEHFCSIFSVAVTKHLRQIEQSRMQSNAPIPEEAVIAEIHLVLGNFISRNAEAWAPVISDWSLNLLGNLSTDYSKCINSSINSEIHDSLQCWMSCQATRTLIDITAQCLQSQMHVNTEACVKTLLSIGALHSPHFDWVIAHVGSCFPNILIAKILSCGLKDYCIFMSTEYKDKKIEAKLSSVVGILNHLAGGHFSDIKNATLDLFMASLNGSTAINTDAKVQKLATVPFLLNLASRSSVMLKVLTSDILKILKPDVISKLALFSADWKKYFNNDTTHLINTIVHLTLSCGQEAFQIINILLNTSCNNNRDPQNMNISKNIQNISYEILELILKEAEFVVRLDYSKTNNIPLLTSIKQDLSNLMLLLLDSQPLKVKTAMRLLSLLGIQNFNILVSTATYLLQKSETNFQLALLVRFIVDNIIYSSKKCKNENATSYRGYLEQVVEQSVREVQCSSAINDSALCQLFQNLTTLIKWENSGKIPCLESHFISQAVKINLLQMTVYLNKTHNFVLASNIVEMLSCLNLSSGDGFLPNVELTLILTKAVIHYFDMCIAENDILKKKRGVKMVCQFLRGLIKYSQFARVLALREILEVTIFCDQAKYFGRREKCKFNVLEELLLQQNHKQGSGAILAQRHSSVFHAGIIGQGPRKFISNNNIDKEIIKLNNTLLMDLIKACCSNRNFNQYPVDIDSLNLVSLLLVELISPDVMYNGLPWPDEEFTKVTVERDLQIRRSFKDAPVLWTLLQLTAWYRPALAYCSVLLRAIIATILANCSTYKGTIISNVMALGQLLPPPLTSIINVLPVLRPHQITVVLRECVWMYIHENIPSPMLFTKTEGAHIAWRDTDSSTPNKRFTETLRLILLANIHTLGSLYAALFF